MAVKIGHARHDENGKAYGGQAGDQTGKEVTISNWYKNSKGWYLLRATPAGTGDLIAYAMERACKNDRIGYDQHQRDTLYAEMARILNLRVGQINADTIQTDALFMI